MISTEPIKFTISEQTNTILNKDAELFEFKKANGSINKNKFYLQIFMNYYEQFLENNEAIQNTLQKKYQIPNNRLCYALTEYIQDLTFIQTESKKSVSTRIKPTESTKYAIYEYTHKFQNSSFASCFTRLFSSYASLPLNQRERIVFKEIFSKIEYAIENKKQIRFITTQQKEHIAHVYSIENSKEELFNYMFSKYDRMPHTNRITYIDYVEVLEVPSQFTNRDIRCFELSKKSPQFMMTNPNTIIKVQFNKHGIDMYNRIYLLRPEIYKIENDIYYFQCSNEQAIQYFSKFWTNATVLSPKRVRDSIQSHLEKTLENYKRSENLQ